MENSLPGLFQSCLQVQNRDHQIPLHYSNYFSGSKISQLDIFLCASVDSALHHDVYRCHSQQRRTQPLCANFRAFPYHQPLYSDSIECGNIFSLFCALFLTKGIVDFSVQLWSVHFSLTIKLQRLYIVPKHNYNSLETSIFKKNIRIAYEAWLMLFRTWLIFYQNLTFTYHWLVIYQNIFMLRIINLSLCSLILTIWNGFH